SCWKTNLRPSLRSFADSIRSEVRPMLYQQDLKNLQQLYSSLELKHTRQHTLLEETEPFHTAAALQPVSYQLLKEGQHPRGSVCQAGGQEAESQWENREEAGGWERLLLLHEFNLPKGLNPKAVTCYLDQDGKLHIQAAKAPCVEEAEKELTIRRSSEETTHQIQQASTSKQTSLHCPDITLLLTSGGRPCGETWR
uniref:Uncharacterized protein n=1 Tax=Monopterus albus TaxID=43700 RepID=A0A3Q3KEN0_MONAL